MSPIKELRVAYEAVNTDGTFSEGDIITGLVSFNLTRETKVKRIKLKGDANVSWTEGAINSITTYSTYRRYFKLKEDIVSAEDTSAVFPKGIHTFNFSFQIPQHDMASSFTGKHGRIVYQVEAKVSRSWCWPSTTIAELNIGSKSLGYTRQMQRNLFSNVHLHILYGISRTLTHLNLMDALRGGCVTFGPRPLALVSAADRYRLSRSGGNTRLLSLPLITIMERNSFWTTFLVFLAFTIVSSFKIQNKLVGKCLQVQDGMWGGRVSLRDCTSDSTMQEWLWLSGGQALTSQHTGECLTAPEEQYEGVHLQPCMVKTGNDDNEDRDMDGEESNQAWSCSKKGHLTLAGRGLHLGASPLSTLIFLSRDHKQGSRWRTLDNQTLCNWRDSKHHQHKDQSQDYIGKSPQPGIFPTAISNIDKETELSPVEERLNPTDMETFTVINGTLDSDSTKSPTDHKMIFYSLDYGMAWKITMLVLTSLALVLGTVILILNVYSNRRKKVVCVLKSYAMRPELSVPGSPVPSERALLTEHAMRLPHSSPTMQRGEILIEWKDGTVTPLYEA